MSVNGLIVDKKDFKLDATVNITKNKNRIEDLYGGVKSISISSGLGISKYLKVGESMLSIYALQNNNRLIIMDCSSEMIDEAHKEKE